MQRFNKNSRRVTLNYSKTKLHNVHNKMYYVLFIFYDYDLFYFEWYSLRIKYIYHFCQDNLSFTVHSLLKLMDAELQTHKQI